MVEIFTNEELMMIESALSSKLVERSSVIEHFNEKPEALEILGINQEIIDFYKDEAKSLNDLLRKIKKDRFRRQAESVTEKNIIQK